MTKDELRNLLLDFANHLNEYKGFEEVRFDFMVIDYMDKLEQGSINTNVVRPESDVGGGELLQGEEVEKAVCGDCGVTLTLVRPGKYQCDNIVCISNQ